MRLEVAAGLSAAAIVWITLTLVGLVRAAEPVPLPKTGQCPSGYASEADYCVPMRRDAPIAVPKTGQCPSGFVQSGDYCSEMRRLPWGARAK
ncbi:MAG: hypothetical protein E6G74_23280 [Alphaproteobacteria bacterium]|nr:MAG: hypothetical protein E6G74_23280 [Alphaproteobacteria bacterium]